MVRVLAWAIAAVVAAGSLVALARDDAVVDDVLSVPQAGDALPAFLGDGTPVFVVAPAEAGDSEVVVVEAAVAVEETPLAALVGWCPSVGVFVEPHTGWVFGAEGRPTLTGTTASRGAFRQPGPDAVGLVRREVLGLASGGRAVRVGEALPSEPVGELVAASRPPAACGGYPRAYTPIEGRPEPTSALLTHAGFATPLPDDAALPGGRHLVDGHLIRDADGARLCALPACNGGGIGVPDFEGTGVTGITMTLAGALLVGVTAAGQVADVAILPGTEWSGAGFRPLQTFDAAVRNISAQAGVVDLQLPGRDARGPRTVPDDLYCQVTVTGRLVLEFVEIPAQVGNQDENDLDERFPPGQPVEVVADPSTCRVLRLSLR